MRHGSPAGRARHPAGRAVAIGALLACSLLAACRDEPGEGTVAGAGRDELPPPAELRRQGGAGTVADQGASAFAQPMPGLTGEQRRDFAVGNSFFNQNWVMAPASTEGRDGLGPLFNAQSCSSCHFRDGRGRPPEDAEDPERGLLVKVGVVGPDGEVGPHPVLGSQFQDRAIRDVASEGSVRIDIEERPGTYPDGTPYSLAAPTYRLVDPDGTAIDGVLVSPRVAPAMIGVGLLENVPEADIDALTDPGDADGDGVSGRARRVTDPATGQEALGRFGWTAAMPTIEGQSTAAFANDIGITSSIVPAQPCTAAQEECLAARDGGVPEVDDAKVDRVVFYSRTLAVPARRDVGDDDDLDGQLAFEEAGCASCHTSQLTTGPSDLEPLDGQVIRPYTDLLLHDMGPGLADDLPEPGTEPGEWRTPPLWGIGLVETVNGHTRFLHDGRARSIEEAILWHGGEAQGARDRFMQLPASRRGQVLSFLESL